MLLSRALAINLYQLGASHDPEALFASIHERYDSRTLEGYLSKLALLLGARVVSVSGAGFEPYGSSAAMLIGQMESHLSHLDKSHLAVHTYFDHGKDGWHPFRAEVELSTCGELPVAPVLAEVVSLFRPDVLTVDYRIRGLVRGEHQELEFVSEVPEAEVPVGFRLISSQASVGSRFWLLQNLELNEAKMQRLGSLL